ncbi:malate synthase G [Thalassotalea sp. LPB0316]|uniref:malate synthase G n=1 Tax=Thalassotalea sp. LPB0316 TaxID=2769490 RepID=UPI001867D227|nr:malate synthase G [Thalassotalea sp. LPB0316]QOL25368.1 malate synthase G [Thalassotalea sp. LPB0316]
MSSRTSIANLSIDKALFDFVEQEVLPGLPISSTAFWQGFSNVNDKLANQNRALLAKRDDLQSQIDAWHLDNPQFDLARYKAFLQQIGYLNEPVADFTIGTQNVDKEIAQLAGPQLVVPIMNARFALNAVNARWGSLYDALYGSNIISETDGAEKSGGYNPVRGQKVVDYAKQWLNEALPLVNGNHETVTHYAIVQGQLIVSQASGEQTLLADQSQWLGYTGDKAAPSSLIFTHNGLHIELCFDAQSPIGQADTANISDILLESALTTIMDCEDSVAAVDAEDKVIAYKNWLGLMKADLTESVSKNGKTFTRKMHQDKAYINSQDQSASLRGRSLMFVRNVGHLMTNPAILDQDGNEVFEGIMDGFITSLIAMHDLQGPTQGTNSKAGSIYIVKPKMHGPEEVRFANELFNSVEDVLGLERHTIKMGIMDEERRTSVNLKQCIFEAKERVVFINTGFLDRTGDEIHTSMLAGPMTRKNDIKLTKWIGAYEQNNVDVGLGCGFSQRAQIGKGMWPVPDDMASMMTTKIAHAQSGANTAWVPSPTAATLHALHYHQVNVAEQQQGLLNRTPINPDDMLNIPLADDVNWSQAEIENELDNNAQGILGYVVRWIDQGVGCSKVPDINNVGLMEDRATLRISSQHIANWLAHQVCSKEQVQQSLEKMAVIVDQQNSHDANYQAMAPNFSASIAFKAASALIFEGKAQPSGYTEPLLHAFRREKKAS